MARSVFILLIALFAVTLYSAGFAADKGKRGEVTAVNRSTQTATVAAIEANSYLYEVYTSIAPASGDPFNPFASRVFGAGQDIYLNVQYLNAVQGNVDIAHVITNAAGQVLPLMTTTGFEPVGERFDWVIVQLPSGTYFYNVIVVAQDTYLLSPYPYTFVVE